MQFGIIGLGRMGANMARRLRRSDIPVAAFNRSNAVTQELAQETGLVATESIEELISKLEAPRIVWLMLPSGDITEQHVNQVQALLDPGDIIVDGANSNFNDSMRRGEEVEKTGVHYIDAGVSGGVWGLDNGYAMMCGGSKEAFAHIEPMVKVLAPSATDGWLHCGPIGSGHFTKMVHNGIEYGMMQAYAEGFAMLKGREEFNLDLGAISEMWRHGSVVRSWLLDLSAEFLATDQELNDIEPFVSDSGEGRWTAIEAIEQGLPAPVMSLAVIMRFATQGSNDFPAKLLGMMRKGFGGHALGKS